MTAQTESERLVKVETNLENLTKAVEKGFGENTAAMATINEKLDNTFTTFVTKDEFKTYRSSQNVQKILLSVLMIIIGALVGFFIANITK